MKKLRNFALLTIFSFILFACKSAPILNINDSVLNADEGTTIEQVSAAITRAGNSLGWKMTQVKPGLIVATLHLRAHIAQVNIGYDTYSYSINYSSSTNLNHNESDFNYDGKESIHSNYNGWIENLSRAIEQQFY